jgi:fructose-1,6-bisphosphatase/inositol monophosphatase family enzyme
VIDEVGALMRAAARTVILPLYQRLAAGDVAEKAPGDVVTVADRRAEEFLADGLAKLLPGSIVVGEEAVAADGALLDLLADAGPVWLVDPLDGTANFAAGHGPFAVMVALLVGGVTRTGWILDLITDQLVVAEAGAGAYLNGVRITTDQDAPPLSALRGNVRSKYLPPAVRRAIDRRASALGEALPGTRCSGGPYPGTTPRGCCSSMRRAGWPAGWTVGRTCPPIAGRGCWWPATRACGARCTRA